MSLCGRVLAFRIDEEFDEEEVRPKGVAVGGAGIRWDSRRG